MFKSVLTDTHTHTLPSALSVSLGMLFPAISSCTTLLFFCRASSRDLPPSRPMLFHLRSVNAVREKDQSGSSVRHTINTRIQQKSILYHSKMWIRLSDRRNNHWCVCVSIKLWSENYHQTLLLCFTGTMISS